MKVVCATHSSRPFVEARASVNALETRFSSRDDLSKVELSSFPCTRDAIPFTGQLTFWEVDPEEPGNLRFLHAYSPDYKIQFAAFDGSRLLVYGSDRLEIFDHNFNLISTVRDRWMVGGHTVYPGEDGTAWVTAAPANAVLKVDLDRLRVVERIRMPERYGRGVQLREEDDLHPHFIPTDLQPTHVNSAVPFRGGLLVTFCKQGVVGHLGFDGSYREIIRGFRGAHGGRPVTATGEILLTDSPAGILWFIDFESGAIRRRLQLDSHWVHDADFIDSDHLVVGLSDHNELRVIEAATGGEVGSVACSPFGASVMFVNVCEVGSEWAESLVPISQPESNTEGWRVKLGKELLPSMLDGKQWMHFATPEVVSRVGIASKEALRYEYLVATCDFEIQKGSYMLSSDLLCRVGGTMIGVLDVKADTWVTSHNHDSLNRKGKSIFELTKKRLCRVIVTANNPNHDSRIDAEIHSLSLRPILPTSKES